MTVVIPKHANKAQIKQALDSIRKPQKPFNADKYFGKIKWGQDALEFQKSLRDE